MEYAKEVLNALPEDVRKAASGDMRAYLLGSFGPDFLFMLKEMKRPNDDYGPTIHHTTVYPCIQKVAKYLQTNNTTIKFSYMLGFLVHYVMDSILHPYVFYTEENYMQKALPEELKSTAHNHIESAIDCYIMDERRPNKVNPASYDPCPEMCMKKAVLSDIADIFTDVFNKHYGRENCTKSDLMNSFKMTKLLIWISVDRFGKLKELCQFIERKSKGPHRMTAFVHPPIGYRREIDYLNHERRPFDTVLRSGTQDNTATVEELLDACKQPCVEVLTEFWNAVTKDTPISESHYKLDFVGEIAKDKWEG